MGAVVRAVNHYCRMANCRRSGDARRGTRRSRNAYLRCAAEDVAISAYDRGESGAISIEVQRSVIAFRSISAPVRRFRSTFASTTNWRAREHNRCIKPIGFAESAITGLFLRVSDNRPSKPGVQPSHRFDPVHSSRCFGLTGPRSSRGGRAIRLRSASGPSHSSAELRRNGSSKPRRSSLVCSWNEGGRARHSPSLGVRSVSFLSRATAQWLIEAAPKFIGLFVERRRAGAPAFASLRSESLLAMLRLGKPAVFRLFRRHGLQITPETWVTLSG